MTSRGSSATSTSGPATTRSTRPIRRRSAPCEGSPRPSCCPVMSRRSPPSSPGARRTAWRSSRAEAGPAGREAPCLRGSGIVLGLERLNRVRSLDPLQWRMEVEAGVTTATVHRLARENGLWFPPDPGAAEQSQIGGNIATNAGGPHCFKYGVTGAWVTGIEAVLSGGQVIRVGGATRKDVAGYDLRGLLVGSEGTLGIITAAWLRLLPPPAVTLPVAAFYASASAGAEAVASLMAAGPVPAAIEYLDAATLRIAAAGFPGGMPPGAGFLVLTEADTSVADRELLAEALSRGLARRSDRPRGSRRPVALARRRRPERDRRARRQAVRRHRRSRRSARRGDRGDDRDRRAPRRRGVLVGTRGRREPAFDVPARSRATSSPYGARRRRPPTSWRWRSASAGPSAGSTGSAC